MATFNEIAGNWQLQPSSVNGTCCLAVVTENYTCPEVLCMAYRNK